MYPPPHMTYHTCVFLSRVIHTNMHVSSSSYPFTRLCANSPTHLHIWFRVRPTHLYMFLIYMVCSLYIWSLHIWFRVRPTHLYMFLMFLMYDTNKWYRTVFSLIYVFLSRVCARTVPHTFSPLFFSPFMCVPIYSPTHLRKSRAFFF
jgi:hypothetical protein